MSPNFKDIEHEQFYEGNLRMVNIPQDSYHKSLFYTLGLSPQTRQHIKDLYDHQDNCIRLEGLQEGWQTGTTLKITRLAFNLFNGFTGDSELNPDRPRNYSPYFLFDTNLMPYFLNPLSCGIQSILTPLISHPSRSPCWMLKTCWAFMNRKSNSTPPYPSSKERRASHEPYGSTARSLLICYCKHYSQRRSLA